MDHHHTHVIKSITGYNTVLDDDNVSSIIPSNLLFNYVECVYKNLNRICTQTTDNDLSEFTKKFFNT